MMASYSSTSYKSRVGGERFYLYKDGVYSDALKPGWYKKSISNNTQDFSGDITLTEMPTYISSIQTIGSSNYGAIVSNPIDLESYKAEGYRSLCAEVEGARFRFGYIKNFDSYTNNNDYTKLLYCVRPIDTLYYNATELGISISYSPLMISIPLEWEGGDPVFTGGRIGFVVISKHRLKLTKLWLEK